MATLYTCPAQDAAPRMHPCGRAAKALRDHGHPFAIETVGGVKALPWTRRGRRDGIRELTGQEDVPVLVADDGTVVTGNRAIVRWAAEHPAPPAASTVGA
jgi:glutathione S-transferase